MSKLGFFKKSSSIFKKNQIGALVVATELFMLSDQSRGFEATHEFYERKIEGFEDFDNFFQEILPVLNVSSKGLFSILDLFKNPYK